MKGSQIDTPTPVTEQVVEIPLAQLHPFEGHPFKVQNDDSMLEMAESIRQYGVLVPGIVRPDPDGGYEMIACHRRHRASQLAGKETMPVIVRNMDDDAAIIMVTFSSDTLRKYFPRSYTPQKMQDTIIKLLEQWQRKRQQQHQR